MKPGPDVNPVAKLRETLVKYEDSRTQRRQQMVEIMLAMDLDRLPDLVRRGKHLRVGASTPRRIFRSAYISAFTSRRISRHGMVPSPCRAVLPRGRW